LGHNEPQKSAAAPATAAIAKLMPSALAAPVAEAMGGKTLEVAAAVNVGLCTVLAEE
jgi:hypothetical protein